MSIEKYLTLPVELEDDMKSLIKRSYANAINEMEGHEFSYIDKKIERKIQDTKGMKPEWISSLASLYECLYSVLDQARENKIDISQEAHNAIGAALFYFINPYDIIPDFTPEIGYADDYYVLILCAKHLSGKDKEVVINQLSEVVSLL